MTRARFGESFPTTAERRKSTLDARTPRHELGESVQVSRHIREALDATIEQEGWPEVPSQLSSPESLFDAAHAAVTERWQQVVTPLLSENSAGWVERLRKTDGAEDMIDMLENPTALEAKMQIRQFGLLESMRQSVPEAWQTLVLASSERQLAAVATVREWLKKMTPEQVAETGMTKPELELFTDIAAVLGKYLDHAYAKQIALADAPGGSEKTKRGDEKGAKYFYDVYSSPESDDIDVLTYTQVFPYEWPKIKTRLEAVAEKVNRLLAVKQLPQSYSELPAFLTQMAATYGSESVDPKVLDEQWRGLMKRMRELAQNGCPIMLVPQACPSVAGDADKVDVEMRLGLRTPEVREQETGYEVFRREAMELNQESATALNELPTVPPLIMNYQPLAHGPNLYWMTRGEADSERIMSHTNAIRDVARTTEQPLAQKLLGNLTIDTSAYEKAAAGETITHEFAHKAIPASDNAVNKRIGGGHNKTIVEEIKAVTGSMHLVDRVAKKGALPKTVDLEVQLLAKIGTTASYFVNKSDAVGSSGEPYYLAGVAVYDRLLRDGLLSPSAGGSYELGPVAECVEKIGLVGREIMDMYASDNTTPETISAYVEGLRARKNSPEIQALIRAVKQ